MFGSVEVEKGLCLGNLTLPCFFDFRHKAGELVHLWFR